VPGHRHNGYLKLDADPQVYRLGYGTETALAKLRAMANQKQFGLRVQHGVRIGPVISDDVMMVFSPVPLFIEAGSTSIEKPNAIIVSGVVTDRLAEATGTGPADKVRSQEIGNEALTPAKVQALNIPAQASALIRRAYGAICDNRLEASAKTGTGREKKASLPWRVNPGHWPLSGVLGTPFGAATPHAAVLARSRSGLAGPAGRIFLRQDGAQGAFVRPFHRRRWCRMTVLRRPLLSYIQPLQSHAQCGWAF
jgi:hypothetical protein